MEGGHRGRETLRHARQDCSKACLAGVGEVGHAGRLVGVAACGSSAIVQGPVQALGQVQLAGHIAGQHRAWDAVNQRDRALYTC
jgi:hypothetical protein